MDYESHPLAVPAPQSQGFGAFLYLLFSQTKHENQRTVLTNHFGLEIWTEEYRWQINQFKM